LLRGGYSEIQPLELDLKTSQEKITWCDHLVIVYPIWWGMMPALLKGFLDRCWLPGFAFKYHKNDPMWDKLLKGRSARMIITSDAPYLFNLLIYWNAPYKVMKNMVLKFSGFSPVKITAIGRVKNLANQERKKWVQKVKLLGSTGA
jgi:putative NADPH-quinone reductase